MAIAFVETLAAIKFGNGMFTAPWPKKVVVAWGVAAAVTVVVLTTWSIRFYSPAFGATTTPAAAAAATKAAMKDADSDGSGDDAPRRRSTRGSTTF